MYTPTWDCEYGNYRDMNNEHDWYDYFYPTNKQCYKAVDEYRWRVKEIILELAEGFGFNTDDWEERDIEIFIERVGLCL